MSKWIQSSPYHWTGPVGWTICRVVVNDVEKYELWEGNGRDYGGCRFRGGSLASVEDSYTENTGDAFDYAGLAESKARMAEAEQVLNPAMSAFMAGRTR